MEYLALESLEGVSPNYKKFFAATMVAKSKYKTVGRYLA